MAMFFSASTMGFYIDGIHKTMPKDKVEISESLHQQLLAGQTAGKVITPDDHGNPILADPSIEPPPAD